MSRLIRKSHNVSVLVYHLVCVAKYRRVVFDETVDAMLGDAVRFELTFLEIGLDGDHVHFLAQVATGTAASAPNVAASGKDQSAQMRLAEGRAKAAEARAARAEKAAASANAKASRSEVGIGH